VLSVLPYLILLIAEFGCFHSIRSQNSPVPDILVNAMDILSVPLFLKKPIEVLRFRVIFWKGITLCDALLSPDFPLLIIHQRSTRSAAIIH
jgi:hypothetical protein